MNNKKLIQWLLSDETGCSSKHIVGHMFDIDVYEYAPCDASDRMRCIKLLKIIPEFMERIDEMRIYKGWDEQIELIKKEFNK